eukprot:762630-Hanusia_phi.AAC.5
MLLISPQASFMDCSIRCLHVLRLMEREGKGKSRARAGSKSTGGREELEEEEKVIALVVCAGKEQNAG